MSPGVPCLTNISWLNVGQVQLFSQSRSVGLLCGYVDPSNVAAVAQATAVVLAAFNAGDTTAALGNVRPWPSPTVNPSKSTRICDR